LAGLLLVFRRWSLAACLIAGGVAVATAQTPPVQSSTPEQRRAEQLATIEAQRALRELQPLFPHLGVQILQELRELEKRPEANPGPWVEPIRRRYTSPGPFLAPPKSLDSTIAGRDPLEGLSADERIVRSGGVQRLLIRLALTGRIDQQAFESFVQRLQGN
jgi:hypothetical protein